jgi:hypothetical protein
MDETQKALDDLKELISKPLVLALPQLSEILLLNVTTTTQVISAALVVERSNPGTSTMYNDRYTTSTRSSLTARPTTTKYESYSMSS